ncbi:MAG: T9SS type B sorting domain-containing protein [Cyclobacteriaceae bacterium]|nr:T9SS type B sorting domain-containing protein [Cyclobacteriaceae bacterium]
MKVDLKYLSSIKRSAGMLVLCLLIVANLFFSFGLAAQTISKAEYFFDADPGKGNGTPISITPSGNVTFTTSIPTTSLSQGFHQLGIRVKETGGVWSIFESRGFYITAATSNASNIAGAEYFFDSDPGVGNGTNIPVSTGANVNFVVSVPTASLTSGFHFLAIRTKDTSGRWGVFEARGFYITASTTNVPNIAAAEYFFDSDPGNGNATPLSIPAGATSNFTVSLPANGLQPGFHFLSIRVKDANGNWGIFESRGFYVTGSTTDVANITQAEYFFDADPGNGNGTSLSVPSGSTSTFTATIPVTGLTPGFHFLTIRAKRADGNWGIFESRGFYISPIIATTGDIVAAEYFIDSDPGEDQGKPVTVNPTAATINQVFPIATSGISSGTHTLGFRVKDANGIWSSAETQTFTILACTPPVAPTAADLSRCNSGTVTMQATAGASGTQVYKWYADASTTTSLFTGASFTTPSLTTTTNYFVSVFDPATLCESSRTQVKAIINNISKPTLNASGTISLCQGASFLLSAPIGFTQYAWSNGALTQQVLVTASGSFSVTVGNGTCTSESSDVVTFNFTTEPCGGGVIVDPNNKPPVIASAKASTTIGGKIILPLAGLLSDDNNNLDIASLRIVVPPLSGAQASINANQELVIDYANVNFSGQETVTVQVCDLNVSCSQQQITVDVTGQVFVYNALSPNGDGLNEVLFIEYIALLEEAKNNTVRIFNRWGDVVYEAENYNNTSIAFRGISTSGDAIPAGTYFYRIDFKSGLPAKTGFFSLRR